MVKQNAKKVAELKLKPKGNRIDEIIKGIGKRIRDARQNLGLTQGYIVEQSDGRIGQSVISEIELGVRGRTPNLAQILRLAEIMEVPFEELIGVPYYGGGVAVNNTKGERAMNLDQGFYAGLNLPPDLPEGSLVTYAVEGNSMLPTAGHGDAVVVNIADKRVWEGLFAVKIGDAVSVKRLQPLPEGTIRLSADDKAYPPLDAKRDVIVGRVVLVLRRP